MDRLPVYILAGGRSRRFGSDKARALLDGKPLILHVADAMAPFASVTTAVADVPEKYEGLGLPTIGDDQPGRGPLGGLATALSHASEPWLLLASCDFPGIQGPWIVSLLSRRTDDADAVVFHHGSWQPLPGLYRRSILPKVQGQLNQVDQSLRSLLDGSKVVRVPLPADWPDHSGVNSREELDLYRRAGTG